MNTPDLRNIARGLYAKIPFKRPLFEVFRRHANLPPYLYKHLHFHGVFSTDVGDSQIRLRHHGASVENDIFWSGITGTFEPWSLRLWMKLVPTSSCVLDVGANTGVYALVARALNSRATIVAFEPVRRVFNRLEENVRLNQFDVRCEEIALSSYDGSGTLYDLDSDHIYSATINELEAPRGGTAVLRKVVVSRLDTYLYARALPAVDLMKLDVETHEPDVLHGFEAGLRASRPTMIIEILNDAMGEKVESLVSSLGYVYFAIDESLGPRRASKLTRHSGMNYLLCTPEIAKQLSL